jgi:hypothetical protein
MTETPADDQMTRESPISVSPVSNEVAFGCPCGWTGTESDVEDWHVDESRDRVVRVCPDCGAPRPDWGALRPIDAVARLAKGDLRQTLVDEGVVDGG